MLEIKHRQNYMQRMGEGRKRDYSTTLTTNSISRRESRLQTALVWRPKSWSCNWVFWTNKIEVGFVRNKGGENGREKAKRQNDKAVCVLILIHWSVLIINGRLSQSRERTGEKLISFNSFNISRHIEKVKYDSGIIINKRGVLSWKKC